MRNFSDHEDYDDKGTCVETRTFVCRAVEISMGVSLLAKNRLPSERLWVYVWKLAYAATPFVPS